ncbi:hypothetical protein JKP88DRAFT_221417 [Tribonema minus]|uniref:Uncharacterized protein n=1 Tax=Tribonema minus TaxID=303371 RepID=A0A835YYD4_9STRA|nr:hypothetical protein JKP88DRAFT_221417 [Tribonema minus]
MRECRSSFRTTRSRKGHQYRPRPPQRTPLYGSSAHASAPHLPPLGPPQEQRWGALLGPPWTLCADALPLFAASAAVSQRRFRSRYCEYCRKQRHPLFRSLLASWPPARTSTSSCLRSPERKRARRRCFCFPVCCCTSYSKRRQTGCLGERAAWHCSRRSRRQ